VHRKGSQAGEWLRLDGYRAPSWRTVPINRTRKAWQHAQRLAVGCATVAQHLPHYEQSALADALRGAAYRISLNIAEGCTH
jgi:hypothetical protein